MLTRRSLLDGAIGAGLALTMSCAASAQSDQIEPNKAVVRRFKDLQGTKDEALNPLARPWAQSLRPRRMSAPPQGLPWM